MRPPLDFALSLAGRLAKQGIPHDIIRLVIKTNSSLGHYTYAVRHKVPFTHPPLECGCEHCKQLRLEYGGTDTE